MTDYTSKPLTKMTLEGGIFVVTNISLVGGTETKGQEVDANKFAPEMVAAASEVAKITANVTVTVKDDPEEYARAEKIRELARKMLKEVADTQTPLGIMAPHSAQEKLDETIKEVYAMVDAYNKTAKLTRVRPWIGQMALNADERTVKMVRDEVRGLLDAMDAGIKERDANAIRDAIKRAATYAEMMDKEHADIVTAAIEEARKHAREVAKVVKERGDAALGHVLLADSAARKTAMRAAREAFLDVEEVEMIAPLEGVSTRALDVEGDETEDAMHDAIDAQELHEMSELTAQEEEDREDPLVEKTGPEETLDDVDASRAVDEDAKAAGGWYDIDGTDNDKLDVA